jgi:tetratricopeptide (TPR) repeat protein
MYVNGAKKKGEEFAPLPRAGILNSQLIISRAKAMEIAKRAIGKYQCDLNRTPGDPRTHGDIGAAYIFVGNLSRASLELDTYFELSKGANPPDGWYNRARVRCAQGDSEGARDAAVKAVAFTPEKRVGARSAREAFLHLITDACFEK